MLNVDHDTTLLHAIILKKEQAICALILLYKAVYVFAKIKA
jgi:hypothetical protein